MSEKINDLKKGLITSLLVSLFSFIIYGQTNEALSEVVQILDIQQNKLYFR